MVLFSVRQKRPGGRAALRALRAARWALLAALALPMLTPAFGSSVEAAPPAPLPTTSRYVVSVDPETHYQWGCELGQRDFQLDGVQDNLVILDYGRPAFRNGEPGTVLFSNRFAGLGQIIMAAEQFARGYYFCTAFDFDSHLRLAIGASNFGPEVSFDHGLGWAQMVTIVGDRIDFAGYSSQVDVVGAIDMELAWNTPAATRDWVDGYSAAATKMFYNYGAAEGCPPYGSCGTAAFPEWTIEDVWYINWGAPPAWPVPEIYLTDGGNAQQWQQLSRYSAVQHGQRFDFQAVLTQEQACQQVGCDPAVANSPAQGWSQLWEALNSDPLTAQPTIRWSTDIAWP